MLNCGDGNPGGDRTSVLAEQSPKAALRRWPARRVRLLSRGVILLAVGLNFGGLLLVPDTWIGWTADILLRSWLAFVCAVMAHEGVHGLLGASRRTNTLWGRIALLPLLVPYANFRATHLFHHRHTNEPARDPDLFLKTTRKWQLPFRAVAMPHQWFFWLRRRGLPSGHLADLVRNYLGIAVCYLPVALVVGPGRVLLGTLPVCALVSLLLWIPFAHGTHEGFSTGDPRARSHNYYGRLAYWFSFGLSMHREHHQRPHLAWIELRQFVARDPDRRLVPRRQVWREAPSGAS